MDGACSTYEIQKIFTKILVWKTEGKTPFVGPRVSWENNYEMDLIRQACRPSGCRINS
jgi:hypothetical protein